MKKGFESDTMIKPDSKREKKKTKKKASIIVTSGALTMTLLAATLVTSSFLMSPIIEQIFGKETPEGSMN